MSKFNYILFDWDGTLSKTLDVWFDSLKKTLTKYGLAVNDSKITEMLSNRGLVENLPVTDIDGFIRAWIKDAGNKPMFAGLYPHAIEVLKKLKSIGKKIALVTITGRLRTELLLERHNLKPYFDTVVTGDDVKKRKPNPEVITKALEKMSGKKDEAIIVGDGSGDVLAGKAAGIATAVYFPKENHKFYSDKTIISFGADFVIGDLQELLKIVS